MLMARSLREFLVACFAAVVFTVVINGLGIFLEPNQAAVLTPFVAAAVAVLGLRTVLVWVDGLVKRLAQDPTTTPYAALAEASVRIREGSLEEALPGLAMVLAQGSGAERAELWLAVEGKLVSAARYPPIKDPEPHRVANLAMLLASPDASYVVPVLDGNQLRAALTIGKPGSPVTPADQRLMRDVANGASMLLRGVALNAALAERVRRASELAEELQASRQRLAQARDVERRRLIIELGNATTDRLATLRADLSDAAEALAGSDAGDAAAPGTGPDAESAQRAIQRARVRLDELLDRFRVIARGVYPSVLRDNGPYDALDELAADLPRPVRLTGNLSSRLAWEIESGIYYLAASAMQLLGGQATERPLQVRLAQVRGQLQVRIDDPNPPVSIEELRASLTHDADRLAALGGELELSESGDGVTMLVAWLPDQLEPAIDLSESTTVGRELIAS
jgi:signal transduction histidine kinase